MYKRVSLAKIAENFKWNDWDQIKKVASDEAGFVPASQEEKMILGYRFNHEMFMSIDNINMHGRPHREGKTLKCSVGLSPKISSRKFVVTLSDGTILSCSEATKLRIEFTCPDCEAVYDVQLAAKFFVKDNPFCRKCQKKVLHRCKSYLDIYETSLVSKYGVRRPLMLKSVQEKMKSTMIERYGVPFSPLSSTIEEKRKKTMVEKYGRDNYWRGINAWKEFGTIPPKFRVSKGEMSMVDALDSLLEEASFSYKNSQKRFQVEDVIGFFDYFVPDLNLVIEYFGDYFHANPALHTEEYTTFYGETSSSIRARDERRISLVENCLGYRVLVVWELDWMTRREEVLQEIKSVINDCRKSSQLSQ
jgi:G:T-mismatch repair DNA endonuclease (very short patch repair protein)